MVLKAWNAHCDANPPLVSKDKTARDLWYREELQAAFGVDTSSGLDQRRDFEKAMAHFEAVIGGGIYWNLRVFKGDARRILHEINRVATGHEIDDDYMRRIARQALRTSELPELVNLSEEQLLIVLRALRIYVRRKLNRDDAGMVAGPESVQGREAAKRRRAVVVPAPEFSAMAEAEVDPENCPF